MPPRPRRFRRVALEPNITYFKPAGIRMVDLEEVVLTVEEFESVRLKDLEGMEQEEAAKKMGVSQPTFHRIVLGARKKIAEGIVKGKAIRIEGGAYRVMGFAGGECVCPKCGFREGKKRGVPCVSRKCPECGNQLIRGLNAKK